MEFLTQLKPQAGDENKGEREVRSFERIKLPNDIELSVQASWGARSTPAKTTDIENYKTMEVAIIQYDFSDIYSVTEEKALIDKFEKYQEGSAYSFVPVELIEELYQHLKSKD